MLLDLIVGLALHRLSHLLLISHFIVFIILCRSVSPFYFPAFSSSCCHIFVIFACSCLLLLLLPLALAVCFCSFF